jgi:sec-independent protein translocase protein TatC
VLGGSLFFALGVLFGYFVAIPVGFRFLLGYATDVIKPMPSMKEYLTFSVKFLLGFGLVFEFPVVLVLLAKIGIIDSKMLAKQRRYAILLVFIVAAAVTPSPDLLTQVLTAIPLIALYELSILLSKIFGKKKKEPAESA